MSLCSLSLVICIWSKALLENLNNEDNIVTLTVLFVFFLSAPGLFSSADLVDFGTLRTMGKLVATCLICVKTIHSHRLLFLLWWSYSPWGASICLLCFLCSCYPQPHSAPFSPSSPGLNLSHLLPVPKYANIFFFLLNLLYVRSGTRFDLTCS